MDKGRFEAFSDGVFAIAITLLVLEIHLPDADTLNDAQMQHYLIHLWPQLVTESRPPLHMPMPHWDWHTAAGPPGCRVSALAPAAESKHAAPDLPGPDEKVGFGKHIKGLFRECDVKSMKFAFDLALHADVSANADAILERVRNGTMPCDGAWPQARVDVFARWVTAGKPE